MAYHHIFFGFSTSHGFNKVDKLLDQWGTVQIRHCSRRAPRMCFQPRLSCSVLKETLSQARKQCIGVGYDFQNGAVSLLDVVY